VRNKKRFLEYQTEVEDNLYVLDHHVWFGPYRKPQPTKRNKNTISLSHVSRYSRLLTFWSSLSLIHKLAEPKNLHRAADIFIFYLPFSHLNLIKDESSNDLVKSV